MLYCNSETRCMRLLPPLLSHSQLCNNFLHPKNQERLTMRMANGKARGRRTSEGSVYCCFCCCGVSHSHSHATSKHTQLFNTTTRPTTFNMMTISRLCFISASESCSLCLLTKRHSIMLFFCFKLCVRS